MHMSKPILSNPFTFYFDSIYVGPAPKLSRTPGELPNMIKDLHPGEHAIEVLQEAGYPQKVKKLMIIYIPCNL